MKRAATADAAGGNTGWEGAEYTDNVVREQEYEAAHPGAEITNEPDGQSPSGMVWACVVTVDGEPKRVERTSLGELLDVLEMIEQRETELGELRQTWGDHYEGITADHGIWRARHRGDGLVLTAHSAGDLDVKLAADQARRRES